MATFVLKKYSDKQEEPTSTPEGTPEQQKQTEVEKAKEESLRIDVTGSISGIIAQALQKTLTNKSIDIDIVEGENEEEGRAVIKAISTEDINNNPVETLRSVKEGDVVFISTEGFKTPTEDWFLYNLGNKTDKVFYTVEAFMGYIQRQIALEEEDNEADIEASVVSAAAEGEAEVEVEEPKSDEG